MMEIGQPLHAFDYDKLAEHRIVVRVAKKGEKIKTLDEQQRELDETMLVIADANKPIAIAGIMGGKDTEVNITTRNILLESAKFNPLLIRRMRQKIKLTSESQYRFEHDLDINNVIAASDYAVKL
ncbi:MAG: B3/4 domain-containing protein, partial [Candidatus Omnitrophica bacterium]|nr:B3/4 domain-containing protein [Candidatus Omnitrophota bacterium]